MDSTLELSVNALAFYVLSGMSVSAALVILFSKNIIRAVFLLVLVFLGVAGIYMVSNAEFVAVTQILVYVGGILILLMFGIMLTNRIEGQQLVVGHKRLVPGALVGIGLLWFLLKTVWDSKDKLIVSSSALDASVGTTKQIGVNLMTDQILALEVTAVLLLVALVGAAYLVGTKRSSTKES